MAKSNPTCYDYLNLDKRAQYLCFSIVEFVHSVEEGEGGVDLRHNQSQMFNKPSIWVWLYLEREKETDRVRKKDKMVIGG